jgi:subtilisin family serine protease
VRVAIWDTGVDVELFEGRLFVNERERFDGRDTDGNGFVDDVHGIAFDSDDRPTTGLLTPLDDLHGSLEEGLRHARGQDDLEAAIVSEEAAALRRFLDELSPDEYEMYYEDQQLIGIYQHGTHVAGIAASGNPYARLLPIRITYDHRMTLPRPTVDQALAEAAVTRAVVDYCRRHQVRVVNMSWLETRSMSERRLEKHAGDETAAERAALARRIFAINRDALEAAIRGAPEILFVAAAGNFDTDVEFDESIPAGLDLPNLLVVGAVDQAGEPTTFTSFGRTVDVYANGYRVESFVPGGEREQFSGTSMSAPAGANLAAKLLALRPQLEPAEVIELIIEGARPSPADETILLIDPLATIALAARTVER